MNREDDGDDPWLDQFLAGQKRKEERARETGWGCAIAIVLGILCLVVLLSAH